MFHSPKSRMRSREISQLTDLAQNPQRVTCSPGDDDGRGAAGRQFRPNRRAGRDVAPRLPLTTVRPRRSPTLGRDGDQLFLVAGVADLAGLRRGAGEDLVAAVGPVFALIADVRLRRHRGGTVDDEPLFPLETQLRSSGQRLQDDHLVLVLAELSWRERRRQRHRRAATHADGRDEPGDAVQLRQDAALARPASRGFLQVSPISAEEDAGISLPCIALLTRSSAMSRIP